MVGVIWYRFVRCGGTDWSDTLVPIRPLQWYRLKRYVGTDSSATVVPIEAIRWYRFVRYSGTDSPILSGCFGSILQTPDYGQGKSAIKRRRSRSLINQRDHTSD